VGDADVADKIRSADFRWTGEREAIACLAAGGHIGATGAVHHIEVFAALEGVGDPGNSPVVKSRPGLGRLLGRGVVKRFACSQDVGSLVRL